MSLTFNEIVDLKPDDTFWDKWQKFIVVTVPEIIYDDDDRTQVTLFAQPVNENGWSDSMDAPVEYLWTKELMHYGASIYKEQAYMSPEELQKW